MERINLREALNLSEKSAPQPPKNKESIKKYNAIGKQPTSEQQGETWNVWRTQADFIYKSGTQRSTINKAIQNGEPLEDVLLLALECIATMTGEQLFYTANKEKLKQRK
jgi:hypothetical protein